MLFRSTDFSKLILDKFPATLYDALSYSQEGCGANALAMLTGIHPSKIKKLNKNKNHFPDSFMLKFLRKHGFKIYKITKCNLSKRNTGGNLNYQIKDNHLLLCSHLLKKNEATWVIYWNGIQYHNFELAKCDFWSLINFPISTAYVLYKDEWSTEDLKDQQKTLKKYRKIIEKLA